MQRRASKNLNEKLRIATSSLLVVSILLSSAPAAFAQTEGSSTSASSSSESFSSFGGGGMAMMSGEDPGMGLTVEHGASVAHTLGQDQYSGAFQYSYALALPPGRNGMTPDVKLGYTSNNEQNGSFVGYGWEVDIPYIIRNTRHGVDNIYEYEDFLSSFSGELVQTATTSYRAKVDDGSFLEYEFSSNAWTVYDKKGTRYLFGNTAAARQDNASNTSQVYKWMLEEIRDTNDNYIKYEYYKDDGQIYPSVITYTGHDSTDGIFEVVFNRSSSDVSDELYYPAFEVETNYRISSITVNENGHWVKRYDLGYGQGDNQYRQVLASITENGRDLLSSTTSAMPPTEFSYKGRVLGWTETSGGDWELPMQFWNTDWNTPSLLRIVDVNGDAYPDIVYSAENDNSNPSCGYDERAIFINDTQGGWDAYNCTDPEWDPPLLIKQAGHTFLDGGVRILDYNGDFAPDFAWAYASSAGQYVDDSELYLGITTSSTAPWTLTSTTLPIAFVQDYSDYADNGTQIVDVNADGLPDILYGWLDADSGPPLLLEENTYINDAGAGWEQATSTEWELPWGFVDENFDGSNIFTFAQFLDLNGDHLLDYAFSTSTDADEDIIGINNGYTWEESVYWSLPKATQLTTGNIHRSDAGARVFDVNGDRIQDFVKVQKSSGSGVIYDAYLTKFDADSPFANVATPEPPFWLADLAGSTSQYSNIADIDADGMIDFLYSTYGDNTLDSETYLADGSPFTDFLTGIKTPEGASTTIEYKASTKYFDSGDNLLNPDLPIILYTVEKITTDDGFGNETLDQFTYEQGEYYYNGPFDKKFAGFGLITKTDAEGNLTKTYLHQGNETASSTGEYDDHISKIGKPYRVEVYDDSGNLYSKTINKWDRTDLGDDASFVYLVQSVDFTYDGDTDHKEVAMSYTYNNSHGGVIQTTEWGEVSGSNDGTFSDTGTDKFVTNITYATSTATSTPSYYLPSQNVTVDYNSDKVRENINYYDSLSFGQVDEGNVTKVESWVATSTYIDVEKTYNSYGLVTQEKDPRDKTTTFTYDTYNLYPATTTNALSDVTVTYYDYSSGKIAQLTDQNGNNFETRYDPFDRVAAQLQPDLASPSTLATSTVYTYTDTFPKKVHVSAYLNSTTSREAITYYDGLSRKAEERIEAENGNYAVQSYYYNDRGFLEEQSLPYHASGTAFSSSSTIPADTLIKRYEYDPVGRVVAEGTVVGTSTISYDDWVETRIDVATNTKEFTYDARRNLIEVVEHNDASEYTTTYQYDGNKNLTKITDSQANVRNFEYDGLGRRLEAEDLHDSADGTYGTWTYEYDASGNLTSQTDPKSQVVDKTYDDVNRALTENYTGAGGTEVTYEYDTCTNGVGRLCAATSTGAVVKYTYNELGLPATETKRIDGTEYTTTYSYDRQRNITDIVYPDSSQTHYTYNAAGQLEQVEYKDNGGSYSYIIENVDYGPTGAVIRREFGNDMTTNFEYDSDELYRLRQIESTASSTGGMGFEYQPLQIAQTSYDQAREQSLFAKISTNFRDFLIPIAQASTTEEVATTEQEATEEPAEEEIEPIQEESTEQSTQEDATAPEAEEQPIVEDEPDAVDEPDTEVADNEPISTTPENDQQEAAEEPAIEEESILVEPQVQGVNTTQSSTLSIVEQEVPQSESSTEEVVLKEDKQEKPEIELADIVALEATLRGKSLEEKISLKSDVLKKIGKIDRVETKSGISIEVTSIKKIEGGVEILARAWDENGEQIGFGVDGSVDLERFIIINPPVLVEDSNGKIKRTWVDDEEREHTLSLREDPKEALIQSLEQTISVKKERFSSEKIVPGKEGHTTSTFYPIFDGLAQHYDGTTDWDTAHDAVSGTHNDGTNQTLVLGYLRTNVGGGASKMGILRFTLNFDTSSLGDNDDLSSATLQFYESSKYSGGTLSPEIALVQTSLASTTEVTNSDYDEIGEINNPEEGAGRVDPYASWTSSQYNEWPLNATGTSWISKTGITQLGVRNGRDVDDNNPGSGLRTDYSTVYSADQTGTANDPMLVVEHSAGVEPPQPGETFQFLRYQYDAVGNITQIVDSSSVLTAATTTYTYDDLYRLASASTTEATSTPYSRTYTYNSIGNIITKSDQGTYVYGETGYANPHAATEINSVVLSYDNNGNVVSYGSSTYEWDYQNRLLEVGDGSASTSYEYDHTVNRVLKTYGATTTIYANDFYNTDSTVATKHIFTGSELVASVETEGSTSTIQFIHPDHLGGTHLVTNEAAEIVEQSSYYPFGEQRISEGSFSEQRQYTGHEYDPSADLTYANARYYDQNIGRWTAQDRLFLALGEKSEIEKYSHLKENQILKDPQRLNSYAYAGNNPLKNSDAGGDDYIEFSFGTSLGVISVTMTAGLKVDLDSGDIYLFTSAGPSIATAAQADAGIYYSDGSLIGDISISEGVEATVGAGFALGGAVEYEIQNDEQINPKLQTSKKAGLGIGVGASVVQSTTINRRIGNISAIKNTLKNIQRQIQKIQKEINNLREKQENDK